MCVSLQAGGGLYIEGSPTAAVTIQNSNILVSRLTVFEANLHLAQGGYTLQTGTGPTLQAVLSMHSAAHRLEAQPRDFDACGCVGVIVPLCVDCVCVCVCAALPCRTTQPTSALVSR